MRGDYDYDNDNDLDFGGRLDGGGQGPNRLVGLFEIFAPNSLS